MKQREREGERINNNGGNDLKVKCNTDNEK